MRFYLIAVVAGLASARAEGLSAPQAELLSQHRFAVKDGRVTDPEGRDVPAAELPYVLERLQSGRRLKALVEVNMILNKSAGEKRLTADEREAIRKILRESWPHFTLHARRQFRGYFSLQELEELERVPEPAPAAPVVLAETAASPTEPPKPRPAANTILPAVLVPAAAAKPALPAPAAAPEAVAADPAAAALGVLKPWTPDAASVPGPSVPPAPVNAPAVIPAAPAPVAEAAPAPPAFPVPAAAPPTPVPAETTATAPPAAAAIEPEAFAKFLAEAQYSRDAKALLQLIAERAPEPARRRALALVVSALPRIVFDAARAGAAARARFVAPDVIALQPAEVTFRRRRLFGGEDILLPDAPAYAALGLPLPAVEALSREAAPGSEEGRTKVYSDGSRRAVPSLEQQAGVLLAELLRWDSRRSGEPAYAAELGARLAQNLLYARLAVEPDGERFLDDDLRASFRSWRDRPDEFRDHLARTFFSCPDAKAAWTATGFGGGFADEPCARAADPAAAAKPSPALAQLLQSERDFRQRRQDDEAR